MNNPITNYRELLMEQQRLTDLLHKQRLLIKEDVMRLKEEFRPFHNFISAIQKILTPEAKHNGLLKFGGNVMVDTLVQKLPISPLARSLAVVLINNLSSHYVDKMVALFNKLRGRFQSKAES